MSNSDDARYLQQFWLAAGRNEEQFCFDQPLHFIYPKTVHESLLNIFSA